MRLRKDFIIHESDGEFLLVGTGTAPFSGVVKGNKTLGAILNMLREETSEEEIVRTLKARFDAPEDVIAGDVEKALAGLRGIGAIDG